MSELHFNANGSLNFTLKDGSVYETAKAIYHQSQNFFEITGTKRNIFRCTTSEWEDYLSIIDSQKIFTNEYDANLFTADRIIEFSDSLISTLTTLFPSNCYALFDNNVFMMFVDISDSNRIYGFTVWANLLTYEREEIISNVEYGRSPFMMRYTDVTSSHSNVGDYWWLGGDYTYDRISGGKYIGFRERNPINVYPHFIYQVTDAVIFSSMNIGNPSYSVVQWRERYGFTVPKDTTLGLSVEFFRDLFFSEEREPSTYYWNFNVLISRIGDINGDITTDDKGGNTTTGGGDGDYDNSSDEIPIPGFPDKSASDTSLVTLFKPSSTQLHAFSNKMWSSWWEGIARSTIFYGDPADIVINLSFVPVEVEDGATVSDLKIAGASTGLSMTKAGTSYIEVDCGYVDVKEYWGSFMDYEPFTKIELVLPYCGSIRLDTDEVMNSRLTIKYHVDLLTGNCIAFVHTERGNLNSVIAQLNGNVAYNMPITGDNFSKLTSTLLGIATGGVSTLAQNSASSTSAGNNPASYPKGSNVSGRYKAELSANAFNSSRSISTSANAVADVMSSKPSVTRSGDFSSNNGILAIQYPYLIITRPIQSVPKSYPSHYGHLSNITEKLSNLKGYTVIEAIHLEGLTATEEEKSALESLLYSGVIL